MPARSSRNRTRTSDNVALAGRTAKGHATRRRLIDAARVVFERDGFVDARTTEITDVADAARGLFYTYFDSKETVFRAVIDEFLDSVQQETFDTNVEGGDPWQMIQAANEGYLRAWHKHRKMFLALDQAGAVHPEFFARYDDLRRVFVDRYAGWLQHMQEAGVADPELDPQRAASALSAMVEQSARLWIGRQQATDVGAAAQTLTRLWAQAILCRPKAPAVADPQPEDH